MNKPQKTTEHDLLKLIAILTMTIDHIGFYLLPEIETLRAIGRVAYPLFAFLIGYHAPVKWKKLKIVAIAVVISTILGIHPVQENILPEILVTQILLNLQFNPYIIFIAIPLLQTQLKSLISYGGLGTMIAISAKRKIMLVGAMIIHTGYQFYYFQFGIVNTIITIILMAAVTFLMVKYQAKPLKKEFSPITKSVTRNSLYYYIIHLKVFHILHDIL